MNPNGFCDPVALRPVSNGFAGAENGFPALVAMFGTFRRQMEPYRRHHRVQGTILLQNGVENALFGATPARNNLSQTTSKSLAKRGLVFQPAF